MAIHKTAIVSKKAKIAKNVAIGPYAVIKDNVQLGEGVQVGSFCVIEGNVTVGKNCEFFTGAVIGSVPQDKKFQDEKDVFLEIGENNVFREYVTVNPGTGPGGKTIIGNNNLFMAYAHVAHDCLIGSHCVVANNGTFAGHVTMEDMAVVGGLTAIHQFVRVGRLAIIGGCSKVVQDIPPFSTCDGHPAKVYSINAIGLRRAKIPSETIKILHKAFKILFHSGLSKKNALEKAQKEIKSCPEVDHLISFVSTSKRGTCGSAIYEEDVSNNL